MDAYETVRDELAGLRIRLRAEEQAVIDLNSKYNGLSIAAAAGDEEAAKEAAKEAAGLHLRAEQIKAKINGLKIKIGRCETTKAQLDKAIMADVEAQQRQDAKAKWEAIVVQARKARAKFLRMKREEVILTREADEAQEKFKHAQARLDEHRATPVDQFGLSPTVLARARQVDAELVDARNQAMRKRDDANQMAG